LRIPFAIGAVFVAILVCIPASTASVVVWPNPQLAVPQPDGAGNIDCETTGFNYAAGAIQSPEPEPKHDACLDGYKQLACTVMEIKGKVEGGASWGSAVVKFQTTVTAESVWTRVECNGSLLMSGVFWGGLGLREGRITVDGVATESCNYYGGLTGCKTSPPMTVPFHAQTTQFGVLPEHDQILICVKYTAANAPYDPTDSLGAILALATKNDDDETCVARGVVSGSSQFQAIPWCDGTLPEEIISCAE